MSGTSLDGIDAALCDFSNDIPLLIGTSYQPYPSHLSTALLALHKASENELHKAQTLSIELASRYAECVNSLLKNANVACTDIAAIGCHGQTVRHRPESGYSLQLNAPAWLAEQTGITVVSDFRNRDIAAGGQGAPLVPAFHDQILRSPNTARAIVNIGGIANLTVLAPNAPVNGFDCGPGNLLLNAWIQHHTGKPYDAGGQWSHSGTVVPELLAKWLAHPFFTAPPPKSCGREQFDFEWLVNTLPENASAVDVQATLCELTAQGISRAIQQHAPSTQEILICGGGAHNTDLMTRIANGLPQAKVLSTQCIGVDPDWVEAIAFAWLARQTLSQQPGNLPNVTGASGPRILGTITLA